MIPCIGLLPELPDPSCDFAIAKVVEMFFVKNSPSSSKTWNAYIHNVAAEDKSIGSNSPSMEQNNFLYHAMKALEDKSDMSFWRFNEYDIGVKLPAL